MGGAEAVGRDEFEKWLDERPKWLQTAAARLVAQQRKPTAAEISSLATLCIAEAAGAAGTVFERMPSGAFGSVAAGSTMKLSKISQVVGVNAIKAGAGLDFEGSNHVIVYGMNGAGKSGYSRLLKNVCGARGIPDLHPDVFSDGASAPSADVTAIIDGEEVTFPWKAADGPVPRLRNVQVFDSLTAHTYIQSKSEATYEPRRMRFLSALIAVVDEVAAELGRRKAALPSKLPAIPQEHVGTDSYKFYTSLTAGTTQAALDTACRWNEEDDSQRLAIETSLRQTDIQGRLKDLATENNRLALIKQAVESQKEGLSDARLVDIIFARAEAVGKRRAASEDAAKVFAKASLEGVGQQSWKLMWDQARAYSEALAYPGHAFPVVDEGGRCVLCHQPLDAEARQRLGDFESFVKDGLEVAAKQAERQLSTLLKQLPISPEKEQWKVDVESLKIGADVGATVFDAMTRRLEAMKIASAMEEVPAVDWAAIDAAVTALEASKQREGETLAELQKTGRREELSKQLKTLIARKWVSEQRVAIEAEIMRLIALRDIQEADRLANTKALSQKKNELAEDELANGYRERFLAELRALGGGRIPVQPVAIPQGKGKISFQLALCGAKRNVTAPHILSEGESRIVGLAAFIADMLGSGQPTPFVFDDPISSLDQEFEERVVDRLVALSRTRQVIVFTHRLSLLALLEDAVKKANDFAVVHGGAIPEPTVISLRRFGDMVGVTEDLSARNKKPVAGFKALRDHRLPKICRYLEQGQIAEYDFAMKAACSDFRILVERSIEYSLLCDVVGRFRRAVKTQVIRDLAKIKVDDCSFLDDLMTRYSCFEHSQSMEFAGELPTLEQLGKDIAAALAWNEEYLKRVVA